MREACTECCLLTAELTCAACNPPAGSAYTNEYRVQTSTDPSFPTAETSTVSFTGSSRQLTINNLVQKQLYYFRSAAANRAGFSPYGPAVSRAPNGVPRNVTVTLTVVDGRTVAAEVQHPERSSFSGFKLRYSQDADFPATSAGAVETTSQASPTFTIPNLAPGVRVYVQGAATNEIGFSEFGEVSGAGSATRESEWLVISTDLCVRAFTADQLHCARRAAAATRRYSLWHASEPHGHCRGHAAQRRHR